MENIFLNGMTTDDAFANYGAAFLRTKNCTAGILDHNYRRSVYQTHHGFASLVDCCPNLEYLDISYCQILKSGESIAYLSSGCLKLRSLILAHCECVRNCDIEAFARNLNSCYLISDAALVAGCNL